MKREGVNTGWCDDMHLSAFPAPTISGTPRYAGEDWQQNHKRDRWRDMGCLCDLIQAAVHDRAVLISV
jgi:hypothetical protein